MSMDMIEVGFSEKALLPIGMFLEVVQTVVFQAVSSNALGEEPWPSEHSIL